MKLEKTLVTAIFAMVAGLLSVSGYGAYVKLQYQIANGGSMEFKQGNSANKGSKNPYGFDFAGNGTLKIVNDTGTKEGFLWPIVVATNGVAIVDLTGTGFTNFTFYGGVMTPWSTDGKLKGKLKVVCDNSLMSVKFGAPLTGTAADRPPPVDILKLEVERGGVRELDDYPVVLCDCFTLFRPPEDYNWQIAKKSRVTLASNISYPLCMRSSDVLDDEVLKKFYTGNATDGYVLDMGPDGLDSDLYFFSPLRVKANTTVHFGGSHWFMVYMCYYDHWWNTSWSESGESTRKKYPVECKLHFDGANTAFRVYERSWCYVTNDVWGTGKLSFYWGNNLSTSSGCTAFTGKYALTGEVTNESNGVRNSVSFRNPEGYLGDAKTRNTAVTLNYYNILRWEFEDGLPHEVKLGKVTTAKAGNEIYAEPNTQVTLGDLEGCILLGSGTNNIHCAGATLAWYMGDAYYLKSASGELPFSQMPGVPDSVILEDGARLSGVFSSTIYEVAVGANVELCDFTNLVHISVPKGATVTVRDDAWVERLDSVIELWLDSSKPNVFTNIYNTKKEAITYMATDIPGQAQATVRSVGSWLDWRTEKKNSFAAELWKTYPIDTQPYANYYPHVVPGMCNGKDALSFNMRPMDPNSARVRLDTIYLNGELTTKAAGTLIRPQYMMMVFGSHAGGGAGLIAESITPKPLGRTKGLENPIISNDTGKVTFWIDGKQIEDPTKTYFSGGWQIISMSMPKYYGTISGIGYNGGYYAKDYGDQYYAEIMSFNRVLTEEERGEIERTMARKWNLGSTYAGGAPRAHLNVTGDGTIVAYTDLALTGSFEGTVQLEEGGNIDMTEIDPPPPGEEDLPAGRTLWFDADYTNSYLSCDKTSAGTDTLKQWLNRDDMTVDAAGVRTIHPNARVFHSYGNSRAPKIVRSARGKGAERNWLDFSEFDLPLEADHNGDMLRLGIYPDQIEQDVHPEDVKSVFVAQDSVRGGGSTVMSQTTGTATGSQFLERVYYENILQKPTEAVALMPVWRSGTTAMENGSTYLDGILIDGFKTGFSGAPQLLTALSEEGKTFPFGVVGGYNPKDKAWNYIKSHPEISEAAKNRAKEFGEVIGEVIAYKRTLTSEERKTVEGYLMWKWMGKVRDGYADLSKMLVSGSGSIVAKSIADMPQVKEDFSGDVTITEQTQYGFTIDGGQVLDSFETGGKVKLQPTGVITLTVDSLPRDAEFVLLRAGKGGLSATEWKLNDDIYGKVGSRVRKYELVTSDTEVKVRLFLSRGMIITYENVPVAPKDAE